MDSGRTDGIIFAGIYCSASLYAYCSLPGTGKYAKQSDETAIQEALSKLIKNKTVLIIAHRMRTITNADHIVVLKDGVVAEEGSPRELIQKNGLYRHMCEQQNLSSNWKM